MSRSSSSESFSKFFTKAISTGLGLGYSPLLPGTLGSLWGVLFYSLWGNHSKPLWIALTILVSLWAIWVADRAEDLFGEKDCQKIVIDEVAGQMVTYCFLPPHLWLAGFVAFRFFDMTKLFPANVAQNRLAGGLGVVADDLVAGVQAGLLVATLYHFFG